ANSAFRKIGINKSDTRIKGILAYKIHLFGYLKQYDSAVYISKELLKKSKIDNDSISIGSNYSRLAYYYSQNFKKDSAFLSYNLSKEIHLQLGDSSKAGENLAQMAIIQSDLGDYVGSDNNAIQALKYLDENNFQYLTAVYNCIAISAQEQKNFIEAIYWYDKAINISINNTDKISYLQNKANAFRYLEKYDKSITILDSLSKVDLKNHRSRATIIDNLAYTKWLAKKKENVLPELEKALEMRLQENNLWGLIASYAHLSTYYENLNPKTALSYASKMYDVAINQKSTPDQLEALQKLIELENSEKAKKYYATYIHLNDSLQNSKQKAKNQFAKIKYDSEKNREDNLQLKIAQSASKLELEKEKTQNIIGAVSSGSVVVGLLFFVYYRKQKHQQEKRTEVYKTETRIAKKIHDEVANNVVNIMNKVQYTEEPKEQLLNDLEKVYLLTRNISHENNTVETGEKFEHFLKTMLTSFNSDKTTIIVKDIHKVEIAELSKDKQIEVYRILQELMVNMSKHSKASLVAITFKNDKNHFYINYSDNGIGLNMESLNFKNGLNNVETRIKSINGIITFETTLNNGFKAFIDFKK
uniref:tetratricopeptide repeat-containing sensor histidine kinase n=1 Tax=Lutibacter sp. TaxID=1925666 RepID=UPI003562E231